MYITRSQRVHRIFRKTSKAETGKPSHTTRRRRLTPSTNPTLNAYSRDALQINICGMHQRKERRTIITAPNTRRVIHPSPIQILYHQQRCQGRRKLAERYRCKGNPTGVMILVFRAHSSIPSQHQTTSSTVEWKSSTTGFTTSRKKTTRSGTECDAAVC